MNLSAWLESVDKLAFQQQWILEIKLDNIKEKIVRRFNEQQHKWNKRFDLYDAFISLNALKYSQLDDAIQMTSDISTYSNLTYEETLEECKKALLGQYEHLKNFGIFFPVSYKQTILQRFFRWLRR